MILCFEQNFLFGDNQISLSSYVKKRKLPNVELIQLFISGRNQENTCGLSRSENVELERDYDINIFAIFLT